MHTHVPKSNTPKWLTDLISSELNVGNFNFLCRMFPYYFFKDLFLFIVRICSQFVQVPRSSEVGIISLELEFTGLEHEAWELSLCPLEEPEMLLSTEPSLQLHPYASRQLTKNSHKSYGENRARQGTFRKGWHC